MKPYVILNAAMTVDGKIATKTGSSEISGEMDLKRVHMLRREFDAIMVGINTLMADDPRLTVHKITAKPKDNPLRVVVDSNARTPIEFRVLSEDAPTIIAVSKNAPSEKINQLAKKAQIIICGKERVDLNCLMEQLGERDIKTLMLEGGSTLNYSMLAAGLVDEVRVCIAPMIAGGKESKTLVDGEGVNLMNESFKLQLKRYYPCGSDFIMEYNVL